MFENCETKLAYETATKDGFIGTLSDFSNKASEILVDLQINKQNAMMEHFGWE